MQFTPAVGTGNFIGVPQGKQTLISFNGTDVNFVNPQDPGTAYDLHGATALPPWMTACKVSPYLPKDGTVYNFSSYTALAQILGSTFGGNGVTTFGVPDERSRQRLAWDNTGTANRVTAAGSGINGVAMGAAGGDQSMQSHNHANTATVNDPTHVHTYTGFGASGFDINANAGQTSGTAKSTQSAATGITVTMNNATTGSGGSQNMPPTIVSFLALIKT